MANRSDTPLTTNTTYQVWVDWTIAPPNLTYVVEVPSGVTISYTVQYTVDDPNNTAWTVLWIADAVNGTSKTATAANNYTNPITGIQVTVASISGGNARLVVLQGMPT